MAVLIPGITALLAVFFAAALLDQWLQRRGVRNVNSAARNMHSANA